MKYFKSITVFLCLALLMTSQMEAQIWKKLKKQVEEKVEKRVEEETEDRVLEETDKKTEEALDKVFEGDESESKSGKNSNNQFGDLSDLLGGSNVELPDKYDLDLSISYKMTSDGKTNNIKYLFTDSGDQWGFTTTNKKDEVTMLIDYKKNVVVMYAKDSKGNKSGQKLPNMVSKNYLKKVVKKEMDKNSDDDFNIKKTGRTKKIVGYTCAEYLATTKEGTSQMWVTDKLDSPISQFFATNMQMGKKKGKYSDVLEALNGAFLEMNYTDNKKSKNNMHIIATEVNKRPKSIKNSDYKWGSS